jgi:ribosomal protein S18 acetylase RimI-like enzyme
MVRSNIDAVLALDKKVGGGQSSISYMDMAATDPGGPLDFSLVAEAEHRLVGFILARLAYLYIPFAEVFVIHTIVADPDYQRRGVGSKLVNELLSYCHAEEINTVRALVEDRNTGLRRFVEHLGFRRSTIINYDKTFET